MYRMMMYGTVWKLPKSQGLRRHVFSSDKTTSLFDIFACHSSGQSRERPPDKVCNKQLSPGFDSVDHFKDCDFGAYSEHRTSETSPPPRFSALQRSHPLISLQIDLLPRDNRSFKEKKMSSDPVPSSFEGNPYVPGPHFIIRARNAVNEH